MDVQTIELETPDGDQGFLEANKHMLEQYAVKTLIDTMSGNASAEVKLAAASKALEAVGKAKPVQALPPPGSTTTNNIQINAAIGGHLAEALRGLGQTFALMDNAPQSEMKDAK